MIESNEGIDPSAGIGDFSPKPLAFPAVGGVLDDDTDDEDNSITLADDKEEDPNPYPMANAAKMLFGGEDDEELEPGYGPTNPIAEDKTDPLNKRIKQNDRLRELGQELLDRVWDEHVFENDPRFKRLIELTDKNPDQLGDEEMMATFVELKSSPDMGEFIMGMIKFPAARVAAAQRYNDYRSMVEDFS